MSFKFYQTQELLKWGTRKEKPEIIKQTMGAMQQTLKRLKDYHYSIQEHCEKKMPDVAKTLIEIAEQLASVRITVQVDINTNELNGMSHSKKLEMTLKEAEKPEEKPKEQQMKEEDISLQDHPVGQIADQIESPAISL